MEKLLSCLNNGTDKLITLVLMLTLMDKYLVNGV